MCMTIRNTVAKYAEVGGEIRFLLCPTPITETGFPVYMTFFYFIFLNQLSGVTDGVT